MSAPHDSRDTVAYTWTCPICGASRTSRTNEGDGERQAIAALRSHIVSSDGGGHGPRYDYPDGLDTDALDGSITVKTR